MKEHRQRLFPDGNEGTKQEDVKNDSCTRLHVHCNAANTDTKTPPRPDSKGLLGFDGLRSDLEEKGENKREDGGEQDPAYLN